MIQIKVKQLLSKNLLKTNKNKFIIKIRYYKKKKNYLLLLSIIFYHTWELLEYSSQFLYLPKNEKFNYK